VAGVELGDEGGGSLQAEVLALGLVFAAGDGAQADVAGELGAGGGVGGELLVPAGGGVGVAEQGGVLWEAAEDEVDGVDDRGGAAVAGGEGLLDDAGAGAEQLVDAAQDLRAGVAPAVDGLLDVADAEEAALLGGVADGLVDDRAHRVPLLDAGVLHLVEEDVAEAGVDAVADVVELAAEVGLGEGDGEVGEGEGLVLVFDALVALVEALEQLVGGAGLVDDAAAVDAAGVLEEAVVGGDGVAVDRLAVVDAGAVGDLGREAAGEELHPVVGAAGAAAFGALEVLDVGVDGALGAGGAGGGEVGDGLVEGGLAEGLAGGDRVPGVGVAGLAVEVVEGADGVVDGVGDGALGAAFGEGGEQLDDRGLVALLEHALDR
jgi:hypothetical protein